VNDWYSHMRQRVAEMGVLWKDKAKRAGNSFKILIDRLSF